MYRQFLRSVFFKENCLRHPVPRGIFKFRLKLPPGSPQSRAGCEQHVAIIVIFLCFYFAERLSRRSHAACRVPCKRSLIKMCTSLTGCAKTQRTLYLTLQDVLLTCVDWPTPSWWLQCQIGSRPSATTCVYSVLSTYHSTCKSHYNHLTNYVREKSAVGIPLVSLLLWGVAVVSIHP